MYWPSGGTELPGEGRPDGVIGGIEVGREGGREKLFLELGHVTVYRGLYGEGMGGRTGVGAANYIWDVQHPKRPEQGVGVCVSRDVTGECQYCRLPGDKGCRGGFREEVERLLSCSDGGAKLTQRWSHGILIRGEALLLGGALPPQTKRCQLPTGDRTTPVVCYGMLYRP